MKCSNRLLNFSFALLVLTINNSILFTSAIDKHHGEGRRIRNKNVIPRQEALVPSSDRGLRRITVKSENDGSRKLVRNTRTRGSNNNKKKLNQNRRD